MTEPTFNRDVDIDHKASESKLTKTELEAPKFLNSKLSNRFASSVAESLGWGGSGLSNNAADLKELKKIK